MSLNRLLHFRGQDSCSVYCRKTVKHIQGRPTQGFQVFDWNLSIIFVLEMFQNIFLDKLHKLQQLLKLLQNCPRILQSCCQGVQRLAGLTHTSPEKFVLLRERFIQNKKKKKTNKCQFLVGRCKPKVKKERKMLVLPLHLPTSSKN